MGFGLLPEVVIASENGARMSIATHIVWHKDKWMSPGMQAFLDVVKAKLQQTSTLTLMQDHAI
jgi:DNA-binding transcriptional LysR family regulator